MSHNYFTYSAIRVTSSVDGTPFADILALYDASVSDHKYGSQSEISQDGVAVMIDSSDGLSWAQKVVVEPRMVELVFVSGDIPSYLSLGCEEMDQSSAQTIVETQGESGVTWSAIDTGP